jgi:predicted  nucleic acid-binding Zn-ribbon protein
MAMNIEAEIRDLKRRVSELEGSFEFLTQQIKAVHKDLLAFQAQTEQRFANNHGRFDTIDGRLDRLERDVRGLREDMPGIVASAVREVLGAGSGRLRKKP